MARSRWTERALACALLLVLAEPTVASADPTGDELRFARHGAQVAALDFAGLSASATPSTLRVFEPYEEQEVTFAALPFDRVLDAVYGEAWRDEEELLFTCLDGYQPTLPVQRVLDHHAWLAFARADQPDFAIHKRESGEIKQVALGPFYLIWENLEDAKMRQEADYGWPYQLVGVDLIRTRDRFEALMPPSGAKPLVLAGFRAFRVHCSKCHALNGQGGTIGPELRKDANPLAYRDRDWLRSWIEDPTRVLPTARMPALNPALPDRAQTVEEILAYLDAMLGAASSGRP